MRDIDNSEQPVDWNGFYYTVIHGLRPGIYWSWDMCMSAIGTENYYKKRGKWRKIANLDQSRMLLQFARVVPEGREFNRVVPEHIIERVVQQSINAQLCVLREERELNMQIIRDINEKLDSALDKITRIETQQSVPQPPRNGLHRLMEKLSAVDAGTNVGCQFVDGDHAAVYIRGKYYDSPTAEPNNEAAGFGIWFSDNSVWNVSSAWLEEFPLSKDNLETMAAFIAVKIASTFLGQKKLYIYTRSHYLTERMSANCNTLGESHDLLDMLKRAIESMDSVAWILKSAQDIGIQNAKQLAIQGATFHEN